MLKKLRLQNFRCFEDHEITFSGFDVVVGKNNTGKSTMVDALKLVANVCRYGLYRDRFLENRDIPFSQVNLRFDYREKATTVQASFSDNIEINLAFPYGDRPTVDVPHRLAKERLRNLLGIIPPVGTSEESETIGDIKYLRSILVSHLTPRHFRNVWYLMPDGFDELQDIIAKTWPGYTIEAPEVHAINQLQMFFREDRILREVFWAGHGFQVWLQLMTFLIKLGRVDTLVLDEPDIFLHSDMQKKLVNICRDRSNQVIVATHAVDIIEEVSPEDVITIDKNSDKSTRLSDINEVQTCITQLGSTQNLKLVHFFRGKTCLFVEGNDFSYLKNFARKLNYPSFVQEDGFSHMPLGGFTNWVKLIDVPWIFKNAIKEVIKCYVVLDRDYHMSDEIDEIIRKLEGHGVKAHIWTKKELENYAINSEAVYRAFTSKFGMRYGTASVPISHAEFKNKFLSIFEGFKPYVESQLIDSFHQRNPSIAVSTASMRVKSKFGEDWKDIEYRMNVIPGKEFFSKLNLWLNREYHIAVSVSSAISHLQDNEIDQEVRDVIGDFVNFVAY